MSLSLFYLLCRWLHFSALLSLTGGGIFTALLAPRRFRASLSQRLDPLLKISALLSLLFAALLLVAQAALMGDGWRDLSNLRHWQAVMQTRFGRIWQWQLAAGALGVLALILKGRARQLLLLISGAAQLGGLALLGHAAMLNGVPGLLQRGNQAVHLMAAACWAGGLLPVMILMADLRRPGLRHDAIRTLMRFSSWGHLAVALVLVSGCINAVIILPAWPPASFQRYSQLLLVKVLLVAIMCGVALFNRYWLVPRFERQGDIARRRFIQVTMAELLLAVAVVLLVSVFATLEPA